MAGPSVLFPILAAIIHGVGFIRYNLQTKEGSSKPNFVSWFIWTVLAILNALTFGAATSYVIALPSFVGSLGCISSFIYALYSGKFDWPGLHEKIVLLISAISVVIWKLSTPMHANLVLLAAMLISFEPTVRGVLKRKGNEKKILPWMLWTAAYLLMSVNVFVFQGGWSIKLIMPVVVTFAHGTVPMILLIQRLSDSRAIKALSGKRSD